MNNQQKLDHVMLATEWGEAAREMKNWQWDLAEEATLHGQELVRRVLAKTCTVQSIRGGVLWTNALDAEAVKLGVSIEEASQDGIEALARRLAHHAGLSALKAVGSKTRLINTIVKSKRIS